MSLSQQITLSKISHGPYTKQTLRYQDGDQTDEIDLNNDTYKSIFEKIRPNASFSTPDSMIQGFLQNQKVMPSFYNNRFFTNDEFSNILKPINDEMKYVIILNKNEGKQKKKKYLKNKTKKVKKVSTKEKLLKRVYKKKDKKNKTKQKKRQKK